MNGARGVGGRIEVLAAAVLWSTGGVFIKTLTGRWAMAPQALACLRSAAAGLVLAWALPRLRGTRPLPAGAAGLAYAAALWAFVMATAGTTSANAIFLQYAFPLLVAIGAWAAFGERPTGRTVAALAVGMGGVAAIVAGCWTRSDRAGLGFGLTSAAALAAFVLLQRLLETTSPLALTALFNLLAAAAMLPLAWGRFHAPPAALVLVAVQGAVQIALPYVLFIRGLRSVPAAEAGLICLVEPVLNPVWVALFVGERPGAWTILGGAAILAALAVRFLPGGRTAPAGPSTPLGAGPSPD